MQLATTTTTTTTLVAMFSLALGQPLAPSAGDQSCLSTCTTVDQCSLCQSVPNPSVEDVKASAVCFTLCQTTVPVREFPNCYSDCTEQFVSATGVETGDQNQQVFPSSETNNDKGVQASDDEEHDEPEHHVDNSGANPAFAVGLLGLASAVTALLM